MSDQFLGEIRMVGFTFAPYGWALCNGQLLSIAQNTALFSLLGTTFGGDGKSTFALPNFQAVAPMGYGNGAGLSQRTFGETGGEYAVTLSGPETPQHNHGVNCSSGAGSASTVAGNVWADSGGRAGIHLYAAPPSTAGVQMNPAAVQTIGGGQAHNNLQPYLSVYFIIALQGIYPSRG